jgi:hypothetical protein
VALPSPVRADFLGITCLDYKLRFAIKRIPELPPFEALKKRSFLGEVMGSVLQQFVDTACSRVEMPTQIGKDIFASSEGLYDKAEKQARKLGIILARISHTHRRAKATGRRLLHEVAPSSPRNATGLASKADRSKV